MDLQLQDPAHVSAHGLLMVQLRHAIDEKEGSHEDSELSALDNKQAPDASLFYWLMLSLMCFC